MTTLITATVGVGGWFALKRLSKLSHGEIAVIGLVLVMMLHIAVTYYI